MKKQIFVKPGDKFHKLTAVRYIKTGKHHRRHFLFRCDCGQHITITAESAISGNTKSCGCLRREAMLKRYNLPPGRAAMRQLILQGYKRHSHKTQKKWNLTEDQFYIISQMPCRYCGSKPSQVRKGKNGTGDFIFNGIDRINSKQGYCISNVVPCCRKCNVAKNDMNIAVFYAWVKRISAMADQWGSV